MAPSFILRGRSVDPRFNDRAVELSGREIAERFDFLDLEIAWRFPFASRAAARGGRPILWLVPIPLHDGIEAAAVAATRAAPPMTAKDARRRGFRQLRHFVFLSVGPIPLNPRGSGAVRDPREPACWVAAISAWDKGLQRAMRATSGDLTSTSPGAGGREWRSPSVRKAHSRGGPFLACYLMARVVSGFSR